MTLHRRTGFTGATSTLSLAPGADHIGEVQAWNVDTGKRVWTHSSRSRRTGDRCWRPLAGWCSAAAPNDRKFHAFDAATGTMLWEFPTNSGVIGQPASFTVDGKPVHRGAIGLGRRRARDADRLVKLMPGMPDVPEGGAMWVFALPE